MGNYTILQIFENPRGGRQARSFTANVPKILDLRSSSEQIFSENWRWVPLKGASIHFIGHGNAHHKLNNRDNKNKYSVIITCIVHYVVKNHIKTLTVFFEREDVGRTENSGQAVLPLLPIVCVCVCVENEKEWPIRRWNKVHSVNTV